MIKQSLTRGVSLLLIVSLLAVSTPAAPRTLMNVTSELGVSLAFWFKASGLAATIRQVVAGQDAPKRRSQEKQSERNARVDHIQILPGDVTLEVGQRVIFAPVAYDKDDVQVGGVQFTWQGEDTERAKAARVSPTGVFEATIKGDFKITVEGGGKKATVKVKVEGGEKGEEGKRRKGSEKPDKVNKTSTQDLPGESVSLKRKGGAETHSSHARRSGAPMAAMLLPSDSSWSPNNYWSADDPGNSVGNPPGGAQDGGAGSGNFQIPIPALSLPGRGINVSLGLSYNSRLWNKAGSEISYDIDRGWPAPGWTLGFSKVMGQGVYNGSLIVEADGTRHGYSGTVQSYSWGTYFTGHTTDGSFIDYTHYTGTGGAMTYAQARYPNGTVIEYTAQGTGGMYPTRITDANGNFITITYVNNTGPRIQTITDTLGRVINFYYDYNNLLTAITGPGLNGTTRTFVRIHYRQLSLSYAFSGLTPRVRDAYPWVIDAIYYPSSGTGYWFGDGDSYSSYGMIAKIVEQRGMSFYASSLNDQGTVTQGAVTRQHNYNYPLGPDYSLTDAPTYTTLTETWTRDGVSTDQAVTNFFTQKDAYSTTTTTTLPNQTKSIQYTYNHPGQYDDGLVYRDEIRDASETVLQSGTATWEPGAYGSPRPTRTTVTDERGQTTATEFIYGSVYNQVIEVRDKDYNDTLLRSTRMQYQNSASYTNRHIFSLQTLLEIYASDNATRVSRTEYQYDGQTLTDTPGVVMHNDASNPYAPQYLVPGQCYYDCYDYCYQYCDPDYWTTDYDPSTDYRGNVTQVTTYADAVNLGSPIIETRRYDITGNMVTASTSCCQQTTFTYTSATQYAYPVTKTRGSATDASAQMRTSATYDFNTGFALSSTDPNGRTSQFTYDPNSLRMQTEYLPSGGYKSHSYDDAAMSVTETIYTAGGAAIASQNVKRLNGRGQVRREEALGQGGVWDVIDAQYNAMGKVSQQTRPYRNGYETPQWNANTYDALGRVKSTQIADGSMSQAFYNEAARPDVASGAPGQTIKVVDAWGRERWARYNASGKIVEVVEPNPQGGGSVATGGLLTTYSYTTLGNLSGVTQGSQTRSFRYDSLGRLTRQKLAEASATLNDAGAYVGSGTWSDAFTYDDRSNITSRTDARGVKAVFTYNNDPLNRIQQVSYDTSGFGDTNNPVLAAPTVNYSYMTTGDVTRLNTVTTAGVSTETYSYDSGARLAGLTVTLSSRPSHPMVTDYVYDSLDRITDVRYPAEYGTGSAPRKVAHNDYDVASRLTAVQLDGASFASEIAYNATSQTTSMKVGASGSNQITENYTFNQQTGLLENQTVLRGGSTALLNLSYDYAGANGKRTGQLVKLTNNLDPSQNRDRSYSYDALGRLVQAKGGPSAAPLSTQTYVYDRYGNRTSVTGTGSTAGTPAPACSPSQTIATDQFVKDFYQAALNRQPTTAELQSWSDLLRQNFYRGQAQLRQAAGYMGRQIFKSNEYVNRNRSDHDFVYDLYKAYLQRNPDQGGWDYWTSVVPSNGRDNVRLGFEYSTEFANKIATLCPRGSGASVPVPTDGLAAVSYDATSNRINTTGFQYDAAGNQTRVVRADGSGQKYQYDAAGRLVKVRDDWDYTLATYTYGSTNQRLIAQDGPENSNYKTYYAWSGDNVAAEYSESDSSPNTPQWSKSYVYLARRLLATLTPNGSGGETVQYHHPDRLGTRLITNAQDASVQEQVALPFGTALDNESTAATNRRFTSYDRSAMTGLDYAVNRYYDSQQGRFTQVDPLGITASSLGDPQTLNMYSYCGNDPVNRIDPSGLFFGWLKKLFSGIAKWIGTVFKATVKAALKVLSSKLGQLAISIGLFLFLGPVAPMTFALLGAGEVTATFGALTTSLLLSGVQVAGAVAAHLQAVDKKPKIQGGTAEQVALVSEAVKDLIDRIKKYKDCADLFGGQEKALKALADTTISIEKLRSEVILDPRMGQIWQKIVLGETKGKTIKLGSNTILGPNGNMSVLDIASGKTIEVPLPASESVSETLAHELGHRTKSKKIIQDDDNPDDNEKNDEVVRKACGYE